jgi:transposase InsO family protein
VNANQADANVRTMCRVLKVSVSGYYAWRDRAPSQRAIDNAVLTERIRTVHAASDATYGMPRVRAELIDQGVVVSRQRVARLMRAAHILGVSRRRAFVVTTQRDERQRPAPDLVKREFKADSANQLWGADMTYVPTWAGFIYLAVVLDVWSRRIVGWAIGEQMTSDLVLAALNMALQQRKPKGVIHHSDQGSQAVHQHRLRPALREDGCAPVDGHGRRRVRQRHGRELLRHARVRTDRQAQLADQDRRQDGAVHLHRGLVQPAPAAQRARADVAGQLREQAHRQQPLR